ncbi:methyltransferase family protein [Orenia metallireducens]|uniref:Arsenite methyltransferase n=1 Tax=Orenia metallireducens TaxID=1413210 RepID=A0A285IHW3_9FIRM|nr:methyltransferase domain-containing protein [Orenia metallireducens]PRX18515.1 methyltransferase family protein [Orenia metallireducens]SNY46531.1 Methyltransferase domain-containing protein [Orenia metallireducens]
MSSKVYPWWLSCFLGSKLRKILKNPAKILEGLIQEGDKAVDIGCGAGVFSVEMAKLVGKSGKVICVDIQEKMLEYADERARKEGLQARMEFHQCQSDEVGIKEEVDFILAFHVVHEVPDVNKLIKEIVYILRAGGKFLLAEPKGHVNEEEFNQTIRIAYDNGFKKEGDLKVKGSIAIILKK